MTELQRRFFLLSLSDRQEILEFLKDADNRLMQSVKEIINNPETQKTLAETYQEILTDLAIKYEFGFYDKETYEFIKRCLRKLWLRWVQFLPESK